ncbi:MAG: hypothetical protein JNM42_16965 [Propionivibrio sp.]|uniref:TorF family putative porin n=1 Tax=Propionivibrio sp. TaxID=2212460 RepID=UPI001A53A3B5|nr:TorF family putative porin [Propionivibrio sp.]MBL8416124.1 hypothetical protein [Propionivibrio sp.]
MKKTLLATLLAAAFIAPAMAQTPAPAEAAPAAAETSPHTLTGNLGIFSSYRFRGIDQTAGKPALQGGIDYAHESGLYVGNWNSNVNSGAGYAEGNLEMDFYGGYKHAFGDFGIDVGGYYYYYPGSSANPLSYSNRKNIFSTSSGAVDNFELYIAGSWKFISLKYSYALTDYFSLPDSKGASYLDLTANYDLGDGWGINGHVGHLFSSNYKYAFTTGSDSIAYTDWKIGVTKDFSGWVVGASYVDTNANGSCSKAEFYCFTNSLNKNGATGSNSKDAGRGIAVVSVSKTF